MKIERMKLIQLTFLLIISNTLFSQNIESAILSKKFIDRDTLAITMHCMEKKGCIGNRDYTRLTIRKKGDTTRIYNMFLGEKVSRLEKLKTGNSNLIDKLIEFETKAKTNETRCGGITGGTAVEIHLVIEEEKTIFGYCKNEWEGINEFLSKLNLKPF